MEGPLHTILRRQSVSQQHSSDGNLWMLTLTSGRISAPAGHDALSVAADFDPDSGWPGRLDHDLGLFMSASNSETTVFTEDLPVDLTSTVSCGLNATRNSLTNLAGNAHHHYRVVSSTGLAHSTRFPIPMC